MKQNFITTPFLSYWGLDLKFWSVLTAKLFTILHYIPSSDGYWASTNHFKRAVSCDQTKYREMADMRDAKVLILIKC